MLRLDRRYSLLRAGYVFLLGLACVSTGHAQSVCMGTPASGSLRAAERVPDEGENFEVYRWKGGAKRLFVHSAVAKTLVDAYGLLAKQRPETRFVIGETALESGGPMPPHKTHQNGTSVDLFVPVRNAQNEEIVFPNDYRNGYGYKVRFDAHGRSSDGKYQVDFEALSQYIAALSSAAKSNGIGIARVILIKDFELKLYSTSDGRKLWGTRFFDDPNDRHDNHIHVDFAVPCDG